MLDAGSYRAPHRLLCEMQHGITTTGVQSCRNSNKSPDLRWTACRILRLSILRMLTTGYRRQ